MLTNKISTKYNLFVKNKHINIPLSNNETKFITTYCYVTLLLFNNMKNILTFNIHINPVKNNP